MHRVRDSRAGVGHRTLECRANDSRGLHRSLQRGRRPTIGRKFRGPRPHHLGVLQAQVFPSRSYDMQELPMLLVDYFNDSGFRFR